MILQKLIMKNFRQFRGTQQIEFASENGENGKNVTVIFEKMAAAKQVYLGRLFSASMESSAYHRMKRSHKKSSI